MFIPAKFEKLRIEAYKESSFADSSKVSVPVADGTRDYFEVLVNPETITRKMGIEYSEVKEKGNKNNGTFFKIKPEEFKLDVLLDSTGVVPSPTNVPLSTSTDTPSLLKDISAEIELLRKLCVESDGESHRPHFIKLFWGKMDGFFKGAITALDIDYKLFTPDARPIRAIVHISLISSISAAEAVKLEDAHSPDITHERIFKPEDNLPLMTHRIYKDGSYYIDIARQNKMNSFRKIKTGTKIQFPPLQ